MAWTCQRCRTRHDNGRLRRCPSCNATRPKRRRPAHLKALNLPLAAYVEANDGYEGCWVCRYLDEEPRGKLGRDHEHKGDGRPRGILCWHHNRLLGPHYTAEVAVAFAAYLNRSRLKEAA